MNSLKWKSPVRPDSALLIVGHGSTENEDSSTPIHEHAKAIRQANLFSEVHCCFWKEEPSMRDIWLSIESKEVYVVADFISEGYFTQEILPRELGLTGRITATSERRAYYCNPVGTHPKMANLLLQRAREIAPEEDPQNLSLLIVGHGTQLNNNSLKVVAEAAQTLEKQAPWAQVLATSMEEEPKIEHWDQLSKTDTVVVVPFFISDGLHSYQDIPVLLGIEENPGEAASRRKIFRNNPHHLRGKKLYYSSAIGTDADFPQIILDQCSLFDETFLTEISSS